MKKISFINVILVIIYSVIALFVDGNGRVLGLTINISNILLYSLLFCGLMISIISLIKFPRQWLVPVLCLLIYLAFIL